MAAGIKQQQKEFLKIFNSIDTDKSGSIDYTEFLAASIVKSVYLKKEKLYQAFKLFDTNNEGVITSQDFKNVLGCIFNLTS